ncbi:MAG: DUF362 domain-containing protein [Desulfomonile tiedjei]|nr:DUF362 domain-containing protein [Desulfomonile tiedjei]
MQSLVTVRTCANYDASAVSAVLRTVVDDLGGMHRWIKPGDRVLLKPNLLKSAAPSEAVVTHPAVVEAVAALVLDCSARPFVGDSPPLGNLPRILAKSGYDPFMKRMGIQAVPFTRKRVVEFSDGRLFRRIDLAAEAFEFDAVISLPKLKTHCQMLLTLAVKNLFGTVIGTDKASWHMRSGRDADTFATALVQIYEKIHPRLSVIDGILAMEGNGPNSGQPRQLGIVAASEDAIALDSVVCRLVGFPVDALRTCVIGEQLGVGTADPDRIEVAGDGLQGLPPVKFKPPKSMTVAWNMSRLNPIRRFMENHMVIRPAIDAAACKVCGTCESHCPPHAITQVAGAMTIDRRKCISCFCCHELCSHDAIRIQQPALGRLLGYMTR